QDYRRGAQERHSGQAQRQPGEAPLPDRAAAYGPGGNGPRTAVVLVEFRVKGVVQKHPARVKKARRKTEASERHPIAPATQPPARKTIRPDGGKVRNPPQNKERAQLRWTTGGIHTVTLR